MKGSFNVVFLVLGSMVFLVVVGVFFFVYFVVVVVFFVVGWFVSLLLCMMCEWECGVLFCFGWFECVFDLGIFWVVLGVDKVLVCVDMCICLMLFVVEKMFIKDIVLVNVDVVFFWVVIDVKCVIVEVQDYVLMVSWVVQMILCDVIGQIEFVQMIFECEEIDCDLCEIIDVKMSDWGIMVQLVEICDVCILGVFEDVMSCKVQVDCECEVCIILVEFELQVVEEMDCVVQVYNCDFVVMKICVMNMIYELIKECGVLMVVLMDMVLLMSGLMGMVLSVFDFEEDGVLGFDVKCGVV